MNTIQDEPRLAATSRRKASLWVGLPLLLIAIAGVAGYGLWSWRHYTNSVQADVVELPPGTPMAVAPPALPLPRADDPGATLVTLQLKEVSPESAFAELAKQSGFAIQATYPNLWTQAQSQRVTLSVNKEPFWTVFMKLCAAGGVYPQYTGERTGGIPLSLDSSNRFKCPSFPVGSCLVVLNRISRTVAADLETGTISRQDLQLQFTLLTEPKLRAFNVASWAMVQEAADELGNSLLAARPTGVTVTGGHPQVHTVSARMSYPAQAGKRIARVKGYVPITVQTGSEDFEIPNVLSAQNVTKTIDGLNIEFKQLDKSARGYSASFLIRANMRDPNMWRRFSNVANLVRLEDAKGVALPVNGTSTGGGGRGGYSMTVHFSFLPKVGDPAKAVLTVPVGLAELQAPFEFTDLPLP
jgi:hypothetical protein